MTSLPRNTDKPTVEGFGREWSTFTQSAEAFTDADRRAMFDGYFAIFPWDRLPPNSVGADIGCGSGRWAMVVAPRVGDWVSGDPSRPVRRSTAAMRASNSSASKGLVM